ncbi:MAG: hypothetical protein JWQ54_2614 [Mucilaginibacter sp.]|nr:hypothetical protein [Mucilaginibacter sp.]
MKLFAIFYSLPFGFSQRVMGDQNRALAKFRAYIRYNKR